MLKVVSSQIDPRNTKRDFFWKWFAKWISSKSIFRYSPHGPRCPSSGEILDPPLLVTNVFFVSSQIPDIALITPCGTLHTLLREENENYHEMSVDTPTVPPSDLSLIQYIQAHVQWYNNTALVSGLLTQLPFWQWPWHFGYQTLLTLALTATL